MTDPHPATVIANRWWPFTDEELRDLREILMEGSYGLDDAPPMATEISTELDRRKDIDPGLEDEIERARRLVG